MGSNKTPRWRRTLERQNTTLRRVLAFAVVLGIGVTVVFLPYALSSNADASSDALIRLAIVFPTLLFVGWWLVGPGLSLSNGVRYSSNDQSSVDLEYHARRAEQIAQTFDSPQDTIRRANDVADSEWYRSSIRRDNQAATSDETQWGLKRQSER